MPRASFGTVACLASATLLVTASRAHAAAATDPAGQLMTTFAALAVVIAVIVGGAALIRRFNLLPGLPIAALRGQAPTLRLVASLSVGARERAVLIEVDGQRLLLGVAPGNVRALHVCAAAPSQFPQELARARAST